MQKSLRHPVPWGRHRLEEVTGILRTSQPGDEALTGYGLAAAQLQRFKANGMKLTADAWSKWQHWGGM